MKRILLTICLTLLIVPSVFALPNIQLYVPGATYDASTETWVTHASSFELWVVTSATDSKPIYDLTLVAALAGGQSPIDNALSIGGTSYLSSDYEYGTPPSWGDNAASYPGHGIYPTNYVELDIASVVNTATQSVHDYQPGSTGTGMGEIFKYQVSTSYAWMHFDAYGFHRESDGKFKFVPPSHDAEYGPEVPEPATMLLFGFGLAGAGIIRRLRK